MGINFFILLIIVISIIVTNLTVEEKIKKIQYTNIPLVTFKDSTMYDLDQNEVKQIVVSSQALNFKNRDELYDATIVIRNKSNSTNTVSAEYILKKDSVYKLYQNVNIELKNDNVTSLYGNYIEFDENTNILISKKEFDLQYNENQLVGKNLYYDANNNIIKAQNTNFKLKTNEENK
jgi:hypothetical protein